MRKLFPAFLFILFSALAGCCVHTGLRHPESRQTMIEKITHGTVALVVKDEDGDVFTFCTGVWVAKDKILTADHCARVPVEKLILSVATGFEDADVLENSVQLLEDGFNVSYVVDKDSNGVGRTPKEVYQAKIVKHDKEHDLALLQVTNEKFMPMHPVIPLARSTPAVGENIHIMGHVTQLLWTYTKCVAAAYREENFIATNLKGPFLQVAGEVFRGNSGGGGFNDDGELVGVASFVFGAPNESFFVHLDTIKQFLGRQQPSRK